MLEACIASCRDFIDYWVICDTGSTDGTQDLIRRELAGIPGELHERPWVDFGHNRTEVMELARGKADYLLLLDADWVVDRFAGRTRAPDRRLLLRPLRQRRRLLPQDARQRKASPWRFIGAIHEYIHSDEDAPLRAPRGDVGRGHQDRRRCEGALGERHPGARGRARARPRATSGRRSTWPRPTATWATPPATRNAFDSRCDWYRRRAEHGRLGRGDLLSRGTRRACSARSSATGRAAADAYHARVGGAPRAAGSDAMRSPCGCGSAGSTTPPTATRALPHPCSRCPCRPTCCSWSRGSTSGGCCSSTRSRRTGAGSTRPPIAACKRLLEIDDLPARPPHADGSQHALRGPSRGRPLRQRSPPQARQIIARPAPPRAGLRAPDRLTPVELRAPGLARRLAELCGMPVADCRPPPARPGHGRRGHGSARSPIGRSTCAPARATSRCSISSATGRRTSRRRSSRIPR